MVAGEHQLLRGSKLPEKDGEYDQASHDSTAVSSYFLTENLYTDFVLYTCPGVNTVLGNEG